MYFNLRNDLLFLIMLDITSKKNREWLFSVVVILITKFQHDSFK